MPEIRISFKTKFSQTAWCSRCFRCSCHSSVLVSGVALVLAYSGAPCRKLRGHHVLGFQGRAVTKGVLGGLSLGEAQFPRPGKGSSCRVSVPACPELVQSESTPQTSAPVPCAASQCHSEPCWWLRQSVLNSRMPLSSLLRTYNPLGNYFTAEGWLSRHGIFPFTKSMSVLSKPPEIILTTPLPPFLHINLLSFLLILEYSPTCPQFNP